MKKKKLGLTSKIFISLILGGIVGIVLHIYIPESIIKDRILLNGVFYVIGNGFLRLMQILVVHLVFICSMHNNCSTSRKSCESRSI